MRSYGDLERLVLDAMPEPVDLVAQSMGGVIAINIALRHPQRIRRLVLCATSGGLDMARLGAADWREDYRAEFPAAAAWVCAAAQPDRSGELAQITAPTLLICGEDDAISPVSVGRRLASLLADARLEVIGGATHSLGRDEPAAVARLVAAHLA